MTWAKLEKALDKYPSSFWWRDDDAVEPGDELEHLLDIARRYDTPLALAVIPELASRELAERLAGESNVSVLQHGYRHYNHAPSGEKKAEYGWHRSRKDMLGEIRTGFKALDHFSNREAIFVPPWNRMDKRLFPVLPALGIRAISTFAPRDAQHPAPGLVQVNTHIDPIAWHEGRGFIGEEAVLGQLIKFLEAGTSEPIGLLTHHLVHDDGCWEFIETFVELTAKHRAVKWLSAGEAFGLK